MAEAPSVVPAVDTAEGEQGMAMAAMTELPSVRVRASAVAAALAVHDDVDAGRLTVAKAVAALPP